MPSSNTAIIWTPVFETYVVRCGSKNGYQRDTNSKEIGRCAQNMLVILGSMINKYWGDPDDHLMSMRMFNLLMNKIIMGPPKIMRQMATGTIWIC